MGFLDRLLAPREEQVPAQDEQTLTFGPAIVRMSLAGKDATTELDALAAAVEKLHLPNGYSAERVFASATEISRMIRTDGVQGITSRMVAELSPELRADAIRLALTAVFCSPLRDSGDIGMLAEMAAHLGLNEVEFETLFEAAKALA